MLPYWLLFSFFAAGAIEYRRRAGIGERATPILVVGGLAIALMVGFRFQVGGDWETYEAILETIALYDLWTALTLSDPGYALLNWIAGQLGAGIWAVNLACGVIFSWGLVRFARRQPNPWLAVLVGVPYLVIVIAMGYTRQGVAIGIVLAGLSVLDRSSVLRFGLYVVIAAAFHKSAIIVLPLVALASTRNKWLTAGSLFAIAAILFVFLVQGALDRLLTNYLDSGYSSQGAGVRIAMNIPPALLFLLFQHRFAVNETTRRVWRNFSLAALGSLVLLWLLASSTAVDRLALHLIPLQLFVFSQLPEAFPDRRRANIQLVLAVIAYSALIQFVWLNYAQHAELWLPYQVYPVGTDRLT